MKTWNIRIKEALPRISVLDAILKSRGIGENEREEFLNPLQNELSSPYIFSDMKRAVERIQKAIENKELILIWGDFDADGVTSTSILYKTLKFLGANFDYVIPDREKMGHGLNTKFLLPYIAKNKPKVLITVDCGISNVKEISLIKSFKVDVILTDHHKAPETLPEAYAIINPKAENSLVETLSVQEIKKVSELAGAGVAYKLAIALLEKKECEQLKNEILALACIGTIADVVPLLYENRAIAAKGLKLLNNGVHKGANLLFEANSKGGEKGQISSYDVAFILAPRINAAGRLATAEPAFKLLTEEDDTVIKTSLKELENYNRVRQNLCDKITLEAVNEVTTDSVFKKQRAIILFNEGWHIGVIGIVASKLVEKFNKPVFLITKDDENMARCSIRGTKDYNIAEILDENAELFTGGFGGHSLAGGFSFDLEKITFENVKNALLNTFSTKEEIKQKSGSLDIDMVLEASDINEELISDIEKLEPTGQDNPSPVFALRGLSLVSKKPLGKEGKHLSFAGKKDGKTFDCIWWNRNDLPINVNDTFDLAFKPKINVYNNQSSIRLYASDMISEHSLKEEKIKFYDHRMKNGILDNIEEYVKRPNVSIDVFARKIKTKTTLQKYPEITSRIIGTGAAAFKNDDIMFFDYPTSAEDFVEFIEPKKDTAGKIHLIKEEFSENIEDYIKQLIGMLKYATNNKDGNISISEFAELIGVNESFVQISLDILEELNSLEVLDVDKIRFIAPPHLENFYKHPEFNTLSTEFNKIIEFKKYIIQAPLDDIQKLIQV